MRCWFHNCTSYDVSIRNQSFPFTIRTNHLFCICFTWDFNRKFTLSYLPYLVTITKEIRSAITVAFYVVSKLSFNTIKIMSIDSAINTSMQTSSHPSASTTAHTTSMEWNKEEDQQKKEERQIIIILKQPSPTLKTNKPKNITVATMQNDVANTNRIIQFIVLLQKQRHDNRFKISHFNSRPKRH